MRRAAESAVRRSRRPLQAVPGELKQPPLRLHPGAAFSVRLLKMNGPAMSSAPLTSTAMPTTKNQSCATSRAATPRPRLRGRAEQRRD